MLDAMFTLTRRSTRIRYAGRARTRWFHGSTAALPVGTVLEPASKLGRSNWDYSAVDSEFEPGQGEWVYAASSPVGAAYWGAHGDNLVHTYEVEPIGTPRVPRTGTPPGELAAPNMRIVRELGAGISPKEAERRFVKRVTRGRSRSR